MLRVAHWKQGVLTSSAGSLLGGEREWTAQSFHGTHICSRIEHSKLNACEIRSTGMSLGRDLLTLHLPSGKAANRDLICTH